MYQHLKSLKISENLTIIPILHHGILFTETVHQLLNEIDPDVVAVELPSWGDTIYRRAVRHLPEITVITYNGKIDSNTGEPEKFYILVQPGDPFAEGVRWGLDHGKQIKFIDSDQVSYSEEHSDPFPEPFLLEHQSYGDFFNQYKDFPFKKTEQDRLRENTMGYHLKKLQKSGQKVIALVGMAHYRGIIAGMDHSVQSIFSGVQPGAKLHSIPKESIASILPDYPVISFFYEIRRQNLTPPKEIVSTLKKVGQLKLLNGLGNRYELFYQESIWKLYKQFQESLFKFDGTRLQDRRHLLYHLYKATGEIYAVRYKEPFYPWQLKNMVKFGRNVSILKGHLLPQFFTVVQAAKGCVDDNYAWEMMQMLGYYPLQPEQSTLPQIDINELNNYHSLFIRRREKKLPKSGLKNRKKMPGGRNWGKDFNRGSICSHQPEDIIIEEFTEFIKHRTRRQLQSELTKSEKFSTSFFEGVDIKQTLRKQDGIYVKRFEKLQGEIGSVIFIFDEDLDDQKYHYKMTWQGEHNQESDMAFYSTSIGEDLIGPGISRCEYGGFLMSFPPGRIFDVWSDPDYAFLQKKSEKLLVAGIEYSLEKYIVFVSPKPPASKIVSWAKKIGREVIYVPLGAFSRATINKVRIFHILAGHDTRDHAGDYIH